MFPQLTLKTVEDASDFEKTLEDDATKQILISILSNYEGVSVSATVHQIMKKVLTNEVAVQYSLHGKGIKRMLVYMKLCSCVSGK
jgi:hypothetical protein